MTVVVVGGHSRNVGKTSVAAGVIRAFADYPWTAIKISSHLHTDPGEGNFVITEEARRDEATDSSRFLAAGAMRSFWVGVRDGHMQEVLPHLRPLLDSSRFVLIESNGILRYLEPDLYVMVIRYDISEFKSSARETLGRAHAIVAVGGDSCSPPWKHLLDAKAARIPVFPTPEPQIIPAGLIDLVRLRLK